MTIKYKNIVRYCIIIALAIFLSFGVLSACEDVEDQPNTRAYVSVSINPEFDLIVDEKGNVESVYPVNEDAEVLLADLDIEGRNFYDAMEEITFQATEKGFIDVDSQENVLNIDIVAGEEKSQLRNQMQNRVRERLHNYFINNGIFGRVSQGALEEYSQEAMELGLPLGHTKMILRALEINPLLEIDELKDMPINEIAKELTNSIKNVGVNSAQRQSYKGQRENIMQEYPMITLLREDIQSLKSQLAEFEGDEEERLAIEDSISQKKQELELLKEDLRQDIEELTNQYRENKSQIANEQKEAAHKRVQENKEKVRQRKENNNGKREKAVQNWIQSFD